MRTAQRILLTLIALLTLAVASALGLATYFSREQAPVTRAEAQASLNAAIGWMKTHEAEVLGDGNQALWRMVRRAAEITHNPDLARLYATYYERYYQRGRTDVWQRWLHAESTAPLTLRSLDNLEAYQRFFIYAITCDATLGQDDDITQQLAPHYCAPALPRAMRGDATCSTHQLMALWMMRERQCGPAERLAPAIATTQDDIETQLRWDPRLRDAYIQRVLMLIDTGQAQRVRPVWLRRVIQAQQADGGWPGIRSVKLLLGDFAASMGLPGTALSAEEAAPDFHATAQGLLLMALVVAHPATP